MGNEIAGRKVHPAPEVVDIPISVSEPDVFAQKHPDVFSVCVLHRAQAHNQGQEVDFSESLFASALDQGQTAPTGKSTKVQIK